MKNLSVIILLLALLPVSSLAGTSYYGCEKKLSQLEKQLGYAKYYGNQHRIKGLDRAIERVKNHCYDQYSGATGPTTLNDYSFEDEREFNQTLDVIEKMIDALKGLG